MTTNLIRGWQQVDEIPEDLQSWIVGCVSTYIVQPFDNIYIRAKRNYNGRRYYRIIFEGSDIDNNGRKYNFPVCYLIDVNSMKLRGNKMNYQVSGGHLYSEINPVYSENVKFSLTSKFNKEKKRLLNFCNSIELPEKGYFSSHRRRMIHKQIKKKRMRNRKICKQKHTSVIR